MGSRTFGKVNVLHLYLTMWLITPRQSDMPIVCFSLRPSLFISFRGRSSGEHIQPRLPSALIHPYRPMIWFMWLLLQRGASIYFPVSQRTLLQDAVVSGFEPVTPLFWCRPANANRHPLEIINSRTVFFGRFLWEIAIFVILLPSID